MLRDVCLTENCLRLSLVATQAAKANEIGEAQAAVEAAAAEANAKLAGLTAELEGNAGKMEALTAAKAEAEDKLAAAEAAAEDATAAVAALEGEKVELAGAVEAADDAMKLKEEALEASQSAVQDYVGKVTVMAEDLSTAQSELEDSKATAASLENEKSDLKVRHWLIYQAPACSTDLSITGMFY